MKDPRSVRCCTLDYLRPKFRLSDGSAKSEREARVQRYAQQIIDTRGILRADHGGRRTNKARPILARLPDQQPITFRSVRDAAAFLRQKGLTRSSLQSTASSIRKRMRVGGACFGIAFTDARAS